jgi:hypothetical protein
MSKKASSLPVPILQRLAQLEHDRPNSLCDPGCEGRCRVCPADWADTLIALVREASAPAPTCESCTYWDHSATGHGECVNGDSPSTCGAKT